MVRSLRRAEPSEYQVGADGTLTISLYDDAGAALSVAGKTAEWKLYKAVPRRGRKPWTGSALLTKTSAALQIALSAGQAVVTIADTDLDGLSGPHWWIIKVTTTAGGAIAHRGEGEIMLRAAA